MTAVLLDTPVSLSPAPVPFAQVYQTWFGRVRQWTRALVGDGHDADDLAQNVFLIVYRRLSEFDGKNIGAWLHRIAVNQVRDHRRMAWSRTRVVDADAALAQLESARPSPSAVFEIEEQSQALARVVARLSAGPRAAFVLSAIGQYSNKEIAAMQQVSINTVHCRIRRARKTVAAQMAEWAAPAVRER